MANCRSCGSALNSGAAFCTKCGARAEAPPPPATSPPARHSVPAQRSSGSGKILAIVGIVLVVVGLGAYFAYDWLTSSAPDLVPTSADQKMLQDMYGAPPFFSVQYIRDDKPRPPKVARREVWVYPQKHAAFVFLDGTFVTSQDITPPATGFALSKLRPAQIGEHQTLDQLSSLLGKPTGTIEAPAELAKGAVWHQFANGVIALFQDSQLKIVQTLPPNQGK